MDVLGFAPRDYTDVFTIRQHGKFTANFSEAPPPIPEGLWITLFGIMLGTIMPSIIRWLIGWKQRKRFYNFIEELSSKCHKQDLKTIDKEITELYARGKINESQQKMLIPLINSIPYLKDYLDHEHPQPRNPNAPLICGIGRGLGRHIQPLRLFAIYKEYKEKIFPKLLESPNVLPEAKQRIQELLKKPWNPYIRRHSALTEKARILKEPILKMHAGWSPNSQMHLKYEHWFGNESNESILEAYGLIDHGIQIDQLRPKQCPNCQEGNKPDSKFCAKCRMVLTYDAYNETLQQQEQQKLNTDKMEQVLERINMLEDKILKQ